MIKENEYNTIDDKDDKIKQKNMEIEKIKRKKRTKRKARTLINKKIDFGIEIIKNICEEINSIFFSLSIKL